MKKRKKAKFFEKHELFKIVGIFMIIAALLTWVMEVGLYQEGTFINDSMYRIGASDFVTFSFLGGYYFPTHFVLIVVMAGFYKFLGSLAAYQKLTDNIARRFKKMPAVFAIITMVLLAAFAGVAIDYFAAIALIPFFITILSKLKVDKLVGISSTFGGVLIGILSASYSEEIVGVLAQATDKGGLGIAYGYQRYPIMIIFAISLLLLGFFIWKKCSKTTKEENLLTDPFASDVLEGKDKKELRKIKTTPLAIVLVLLICSIVLGVIAWESQFGITIFKEWFDSINSAVLFGETIFQFIIGTTINAFGEWDLLAISMVMLLASIILKWIYSVSFDKMIDEFVEGFKKIVPTIGILLMVFAIANFPRFFPTTANFVNSILKQGTDTIYVFACGIVNGLFSPNFGYGLLYTSSAFTALENVDNVALALQTGYGLISLVAPSSIILVTGLSMLKVRYSEWLKFIWKFAVLVLILLVAILIVL